MWRAARGLAGIVCLLGMPGATTAPAIAEAPAPSHRRVRLELPGAPSALIPADLNGDGLQDLVVALVYTELDDVQFERAEGFIHVTEIVPALFERREARAWLQQPDGAYRPAGGPMPMPASLLSMSAGPPGLPVIALTDEGVSRLRLAAEPSGAALQLEPLIADPPVLRGAGSFIPGLLTLADLDADRVADLVIPALDGLAIYRAAAGGIASPAASRVSLPGDKSGADGRHWRRYPIPSVDDVDRDGRPDLISLQPDPARSSTPLLHILRGAGGGRFHPAATLRPLCVERPSRATDAGDLAYFGDMTGRGDFELVLKHELSAGEDDLDEARRPRMLYAFHRLLPGLTLEAKPHREVEVVGHGFGDEWPDPRATEFRDLDGDGRKDLVLVTLDFSMMQVLRVLATKRFGMGLEFHVWSQDAGGSFTEVPGLELKEKLLLDLGDLKLGRFGHFAGDFDADGTIDFAHLGRGRTVAVHRGRPGCRYAARPDMEIDLGEAPEDPALIRVLDLNADRRADLAVTRPRQAEPGASAPVALDLYLSGGGR